MKNVLTTLVALVAFVFSAVAQNNTGEIKGQLFDKESGKPIPFATVQVDLGSSPRGATTDMEGRFTIKPLPPGSYTVIVRSMGYGEVKFTGVAVNPDKITWMKNTKISVTAITKKEAVVTAYKNPLIKPEDPSAMTVLSGELKTRTDIKAPARMVANLSSEVKMAEDGSNRVIIRGSRSDASGYYFDGVKMTSVANIPGSSIGSVTVYTGGVPAKYGDLTGGVVVMESKSYFDLWREWKASQN